MNKEQLIARYKTLVEKLREEPHNVVMSAGGALVILGMRKRVEIVNVDVLPNVYKWLTNTKDVVKKDHIDPFIQFDSCSRIHESDEMTGIVCIDGIWLYSPGELLRQKRRISSFPNRNRGRLARDIREMAMLQELMRSPTITAKMITPT